MGNNVFSPRTLTDLPTVATVPDTQVPGTAARPPQPNNNVLVHVNPNDLLNIKPVSDAVARVTNAAASFINNGNLMDNRTMLSDISDWPSNLLNVYNSNTSPMGSVSSLSGGRGPGMPETDESNRKRQVRLLKNRFVFRDYWILFIIFYREAAKECRRKKKEYVKCLENRVAVLENQNKALIEELKTLKELYCRKEKAELS